MSKTHQPKKSRETKHQAIVVATSDGKIQFADLTARQWLKRFFSRPVHRGLLPRKVCRWLASHQRTADSFVAKQQNTRLYLKKKKDYTHHSSLLLLELIKGKGQERSRRHRDLTSREREVLYWLAHAKSNSEIAAILGIKAATVSKHLERIYPKLGVENRAAAISFASEAELTQT